MRKHLLVVILMLVTLALSQFACASPPTNTPPTNANVAVPEATPDKAAIEAELIKIENDWPRMIRERDGAAVRRLEADDFFVVYPDGQTGGKDQDIKDIEAGSITADSWEITDLKVNVLSKDVAVVSLRNTVKNGKFKSADGKSNDISGQYRSVDTFVRRNGQWQLVASATVPVRVPVVSASPTPGASPSPGATPGTKPTPAAKGTPAPRPSPAPRTSPVTKPSASPVAPKPAATP